MDRTSPAGMERAFLRIGAALGFLGVAAGAFGAHALEGALPAARMEAYDVAARYHLLHALALVAAAWAAGRFPSRTARAAGWLFAGGILLFSGSLYALALSGASSLGIVTPFGGLLFLAGWACLFFSAGAGPSRGDAPPRATE